MAERQDSSAPKFTIRRLPPGEPPPPRRAPAGAPPPPPPPLPPLPQAEAQQAAPVPAPPVAASLEPAADVVHTGSLFANANHLLTFLGSAFGTGLSDEAAVRRGPEGAWWAEVAAPSERLAILVWTARGQPYAQRDGAWLPLSSTGKLPAGRSKRDALAVDQWPIVTLEELLGATTLLTGRYHPTPVLEVITSGALGGWVIRRALARRIQVSLTPALWRPLGCKGAETGVLLLRLQAGPDRVIPAALVYGLVNLPYTLVGAVSQGDGGALLVDVRRRLPLAPAIIQPMVPAGETWALGPTDLGHWQLHPTGATVDGAAFLAVSGVPMPPPTPAPVTGLPAPIPVTLVPRPGADSRVDAVLLDDAELAWLRPFLMGRPLGEAAFLLPGPGVHLLTAPGGLPGAVPFGVPLVRVGPGALYLELGTTFYPALPDGARQACFQLDDKSAVVLARNAAYRFATDRLLPAWVLWVGAPPSLQEGLSWQGERLLARLGWGLRQAEAQQAEAHQAEPPVAFAGRPPDRVERTHLLEQAQRAELAGNLVQAAELLERVGQPGPAGRLYERAATQR